MTGLGGPFIFMTLTLGPARGSRPMGSLTGRRGNGPCNLWLPVLLNLTASLLHGYTQHTRFRNALYEYSQIHPSCIASRWSERNGILCDKYMPQNRHDDLRVCLVRLMIIWGWFGISFCLNKHVNNFAHRLAEFSVYSRFLIVYMILIPDPAYGMDEPR